MEGQGAFRGGVITNTRYEFSLFAVDYCTIPP